jgi:cysteine protease ATG4
MQIKCENRQGKEFMMATDASLSSRATSTDTSAYSLDGRAVLVTAPRCTREGSNGAIEVEPLDTREVENSPASQKLLSSACDDAVEELTDYDGCAMTQIVAPSAEQEGTEGFDACREYGYKYTYSEDDEEDDDDDDEGGESIHTPIHAFVGVVPSLADNLEEDSNHDEPCMIYVLGKSYHPVTEFAPRRNDESSLFWFTYRCDFPTIAPYNITTDAGWGCMLRSAQMMLGQALRMHYQTREWRPPQSLAKRRLDPFVRRVLTWMADFASKSENVFSLHNMVAAGIARYQVLPGEWWGPGTVSHVLRDLCALYEEQHKRVLAENDAHFKKTYLPGDIHRPMFRVHVAPQGTVYRDSVEQLMTKDAREREESENDKDAVIEQPPPDPLFHPLDPQYQSQNEHTPTTPLKWDTALLLIVPLRLGLKTFNEDYSLALAHFFSLKQTIGILGGRPRGARWFYGATSDGTKLFGLDPHTVQAAPYRQMVKTVVGTQVRVIAFTDDYLRSVHTTYPDEIAMSRMDPSMALGFYCRDRADFEDLCFSLERWKEQHRDLPEMFAIEESAPDYTANISSVMNEMMNDDDEFADAFEDELEHDNASDEDEYVML